MSKNNQFYLFLIWISISLTSNCRNANKRNELSNFNYTKTDSDTCFIPFSYEYFLNDFIKYHATDSANCFENKFVFGDSITGVFETNLKLTFKDRNKSTIDKNYPGIGKYQIIEAPYFQSVYYLNYYNRRYLLVNLSDRKINCGRCNSFLYCIEISDFKKNINYIIGPQAATQAGSIGDFNKDGNLDILIHKNGVNEKIHPISIYADGIKLDSLHTIVMEYKGLVPYVNKCLSTLW